MKKAFWGGFAASAIAGLSVCGASAQQSSANATYIPRSQPSTPTESRIGANTGRARASAYMQVNPLFSPKLPFRPAPGAYANPDEQKAVANKDYAFLLDYYGKKCPPSAQSFNAMADFLRSGSGVGNCYFLAGLYRDGHGVPADINKALVYYQTAADGGFWPASVQLAQLYFTGDGVAKDTAKGIDYLVQYTTNVKNAPEGMCYGTEMLGYVYMKGKYLPANGAEAEKWYRYCLDKVDKPSDPYPDAFVVHNLRLLADLYADENLVPGKLDAAVQSYNRIVTLAGERYYREDAQPAQRALGQMYITGHGVPKDVNKGIALLKTAVERTVTDPASAVALYRLYSAGDVIPADPAQAAIYLDIAVKANWPEAQTIAAQNALKANPPQPDKAKTLLQAAVVTGYAPAQYEFGDYYLKYGSGVSGSVTAYLWFDLAAQNGHADAAKARDALASKLSADNLKQVAAAEVQLKTKYPEIVAD
ncbi:MAG TPA: hypothetical protein VG839_06275 [Asticcacaulis sp.]|nr:hypothetical protein [Asticcacaulis sp.]